MTDSDLQLNPEGTGKKVATVAVTRDQGVDASGNALGPETVHQQEVALADRHGTPVADLQAEILGELRLIRSQLELLNANFE